MTKAQRRDPMEGRAVDLPRGRVSGRALRCSTRELLLLLLQELRYGAGALDGELLHLAIRRAGKRIEQLGNTLDIAALE